MGIKPVDAQEMTFREIGIYTVGYNRRLKQEWRQAVSLAHLNARLSTLHEIKENDFPKLDRLLANRDEETPEDRQQRIWATVKGFARPGEITKYKPSFGRPKVKRSENG